MDPPALIEEGPGWPTADMAIAWGRQRADIVLIRIGVPGTYYSAGDIDPVGDHPLHWPPHLA